MKRPLVVYDGACAFCEWWARYWRHLSFGRLDIEPYQSAAPRFPQISEQEFQRAVQYVSPEGKIASAAEASFLALSLSRGRRFWIALYRHLPGFAFVSEQAYTFIASKRPAFYRITRLLWGREPWPSRFDLVSFIFLRFIALIYFAAFVSFALQAKGLIGSDGILPLGDYLERISTTIGAGAPLKYPTLFWINTSDLALQLVCWTGGLASLFLLSNVLLKFSLVVLFVLYLSLFTAGQIFTIYQWDLLLLETGFVALVLATGSMIGIWLARWLLFRVMFLSGVVKLASGDAAWANLSALKHHFETQPLPTPLAWYANHWPEPVLAAAVVATFVVELVLVFFIFTPRRSRFIAAWGIIGLQVLILLTGNYSFFNLLVLALALFLFDDRSLGKVIDFRTVTRRPGRIVTSAAALYAVIVVIVSIGQIYAAGIRSKESFPAALANLVAPLRIVNPYGAFAEMVTERSEIIIEGSADGRNWREYEFKYKPGDLARAPSWNIPHQPRLDWQMWFAAIGSESRHWFPNLLKGLLEGSADVLALFAVNPFPDSPPKFVRAMLYQYRFTTEEEWQRTRQWWERQQTGIHSPQMSLEHFGPQEQPKPLFESLTR